jgi:hypothetical protein
MLQKLFVFLFILSIPLFVNAQKTGWGLRGGVHKYYISGGGDRFGSFKTPGFTAFGFYEIRIDKFSSVTGGVGYEKANYTLSADGKRFKNSLSLIGAELYYKYYVGTLIKLSATGRSGLSKKNIDQKFNGYLLAGFTTGSVMNPYYLGGVKGLVLPNRNRYGAMGGIGLQLFTFDLRYSEMAFYTEARFIYNINRLNYETTIGKLRAKGLEIVFGLRFGQPNR